MATSSCKKKNWEETHHQIQDNVCNLSILKNLFPHVSKTHLFLSSDITSSLQDFSKEDVEAFLNGQEDEAGHHGAQVVDDVIDSLVPKAEDVQKRHDIALAFCQDLLQEGLLKEAPREPGQSPVNQRLQSTNKD